MPGLVPLRRGNRGKIYFVDPINGSNNADGGSVGRAWQTFAKTNAALLQPFDRVLLAPTTHKGLALVVPASGVEGGEIYFGVYGSLSGHATVDPTVRYTDWTLDTGAIWKRTDAGSNHMQGFEDGNRMIYAPDNTHMVAGSFAKVSGTTYVWCSDSGDPNTGHVIEYDRDATGTPTIDLNGKSHLIFDGIDVYRPNKVGYGSFGVGSSRTLIRNATISFSGVRGVSIGADNSNNDKSASDITVQGVIAHDVLDEGLRICYGTRLRFIDCEAYNCGLDVSPGAKAFPAGGSNHNPGGVMVSRTAIDSVVRGVYVHDTYYGPGIMLETSGGFKSVNTLVEKCKVDNSASAASQGIKIECTSPIIRNTEVRTKLESAIQMGATPSGDILLYNLTLISPSGAAHSLDCDVYQNVKVYNTIFKRAGTTGNYIRVTTTAVTGFAANNNLYYGAGTETWTWSSSTKTGFASWKTDSGMDANGLNVDPVFVSASDPHLQVTSPCIGAGAAGLVTDDHDSVPRGVATDIGAYEYA